MVTEDVRQILQVLKVCQDMGIGAQFGGKYFCHDVRVVRLPRHGASCPIGLGVSCSADRQVSCRQYHEDMITVIVIQQSLTLLIR